MKKAVKIWLIVAASLVVGGSLIFVGVMMALNWDFLRLSTVKYETNEYIIYDDFKDISIYTDTADIVFVSSENGVHKVVCDENRKQKHTVSVENSILFIGESNDKKWYDYIGIVTRAPKVTVYLPAGEYGSLSVSSSTGDLEMPQDFGFESMDVRKSTGNITSYASVLGAVKMRTSTGHITLANLSAGSLELKGLTGRIEASGITCEGNVKIEVDTGKAYLTEVACKNLESEGDTGDLTMKNVIASEKFLIERATGDVYFEGCDAAEIFVETDTGDVKGTLLSEKVFVVRTDTGRIDVPKTVSGGVCEIETDTGNVKITVN